MPSPADQCINSIQDKVMFMFLSKTSYVHACTVSDEISNIPSRAAKSDRLNKVSTFDIISVRL